MEGGVSDGPGREDRGEQGCGPQKGSSFDSLESGPLGTGGRLGSVPLGFEKQPNGVVKHAGPGVRLLGFKSWLYYLLALYELGQTP